LSGTLLDLKKDIAWFDDREWQIRRIVITKEIIGFARVGENILIDTVPLAEVESIRDMHSIDEDVDSAKFLNALMITTIPEGYNSGRTYYLQASSEEHCKRLVTEWLRLATRARFAAEANTKCAESQYVFRKIFDSNSFQLISACLIIAVSDFVAWNGIVFLIYRKVLGLFLLYDISFAQNFAVSIMDAEYASELVLNDGNTTPFGELDRKLNVFFTIIFTLELIINAYANWFHRFIRSGSSTSVLLKPSATNGWLVQCHAALFPL
jgi:hypothetical protein